jgi:TonB-dependent SusC/RagA subfamily outer membrane receptor
MTPSNARVRLSLPVAAVALLAACASPHDPQTDVSPAPASGPVAASEQIQPTSVEPIEKQLMNRNPGVWVGRSADGGLAVRIRGGSASMGNTEPLYILDGTPFTPGLGGSLTGLNPYDIASIKVLKDPADLTMYGMRGANGVIVIKTKQKQ